MLSNEICAVNNKEMELENYNNSEYVSCTQSWGISLFTIGVRLYGISVAVQIRHDYSARA